jgi:hypothetical protein
MKIENKYELGLAFLLGICITMVSYFITSRFWPTQTVVFFVLPFIVSFVCYFLTKRIWLSIMVLLPAILLPTVIKIFMLLFPPQSWGNK